MGKHKSSRHSRKHHHKHESRPTKMTGEELVQRPKANYDLSKPPPGEKQIFKSVENTTVTEPSNLAGRPVTLELTAKGVRSTEVKTIRPLNVSSLDTTQVVHFHLVTNKFEFIELTRDAISMTLFGTCANERKPEVETSETTPEEKAEIWALRAINDKPLLAFDPSVLATSFVQRVEVLINNQPVATNSTLDRFLLHYTRMSNIFTAKPPNSFLMNTNDCKLEKNAPIRPKIFQAGQKPFDYGSFDATQGKTVPIYLNGIFPFDMRNSSLQTIDQHAEPRHCLPPETTIDVKLHLWPQKTEALIATNHLNQQYFIKGDGSDLPLQLKLSFQDMHLKYISHQLMPTQYLEVMSSFNKGGAYVYNYHVGRVQYQTIDPDRSITDNFFQLSPQCRLVYLMCLPTWALSPSSSEKKPISGFSQFPPDATSIRVSFGSEPYLLTENFENFGVKSTNHNEPSKYIYFDYLKNLGFMHDRSFEEMFPFILTEAPLTQVFVFDLADKMSEKTELLSIKCHYNKPNKLSPKDFAFLLISVHPNGKATCRKISNSQLSWDWEFALVA